MKPTSAAVLSLIVAAFPCLAASQPIGSGPTISCSNGLAVDAAGSLFVVCGDAVLKVDPVTGDRTVVSDAGRGTGPAFDRPWSLTIDGDGGILVTDDGLKAVLRVNPATGDRTILSGRRLRGSGPPFYSPTPVAVEAAGTIVVGDFGFPICRSILGPCVFVMMSLIRVDPVTGDRALLSGGGWLNRKAGRGPALFGPRGLAVEPTGSVAVAASKAGLHRVDALTGDRSILSEVVGWVAVDRDGSLVATDAVTVVRIDPATGARTIVSGPTRGSGPPFIATKEIAVAPDGMLFVVDGPGATPDRSIMRVDPATGDRTVIAR